MHPSHSSSSVAAAAANAAFMGYRGCVTQPNALDPVFVITVAWGSLSPGIPPADACAAGAFGDDSLRRIIRSQVRVATLTHGLQRRKQKYGMVTMCIGTGMGAAGIFESL